MTRPDPQPGSLRPDQSEQLSAALSQLTGLVLSQQTVDTALHLVTTVAATITVGTVGAGVTLVDERGKRSKAASDEVVERADRLQYDLDEGPCLTAQQARQVVRVDDTATDTRWTRWAREAVPLGVRSVLSVPLVVADESIGAMKVYSDRPGVYGPHEEQVMLLFAQQAAILLANTQSVQEARRLSQQLTDALASRDIVSQATGVLLARGTPDGPAAFALLADAARRSHRPVEAVAREVLAAVSSGGDDPLPV
jgi:GAF domain-containing protein